MLSFEKIRIACDVMEKESSIPDVKNPKAAPFTCRPLFTKKRKEKRQRYTLYV